MATKGFVRLDVTLVNGDARLSKTMGDTDAIAAITGVVRITYIFNEA